MSLNIFNVTDLLGMQVKHYNRSEFNGYNESEWQGTVVDVSEDKLPLIGVDCGVEFIRYIPYVDLRGVSK